MLSRRVGAGEVGGWYAMRGDAMLLPSPMREVQTATRSRRRWVAAGAMQPGSSSSGSDKASTTLASSLHCTIRFLSGRL